MTASSNSLLSTMAWVGQTSSQRPQKMQRPKLIDQVVWPLSASMSIWMALGGQTFAHAAHAMQAIGSCSGLPRAPSGRSSGAKGYLIVASPVRKISLIVLNISVPPP